MELIVDHRVGPRVRQSLYSERYERGEVFALLAHLDATDRVVEFGSGLGLLTILAARRAGSHRVWSYEANPRLLPLIREHCRLNGVEPHLRHGAVGVGLGSAVLHLGEEHSSSSILEPATTAVRTVVPRLDAAEEVERFRPTFLVVDVEGGEAEIIPRIAWEGIDKLLLEIHPEVLPSGEEGRILRHLSAQGLRVDRAVSSRRKKLLLR